MRKIVLLLLINCLWCCSKSSDSNPLLGSWKAQYGTKVCPDGTREMLTIEDMTINSSSIIVGSTTYSYSSDGHNILLIKNFGISANGVSWSIDGSNNLILIQEDRFADSACTLTLVYKKK